MYWKNKKLDTPFPEKISKIQQNIKVQRSTIKNTSLRRTRFLFSEVVYKKVKVSNC